MQASGVGVGVIGLGLMGSAIAANLQRAGFAVSGVDIDAQARERMRDSIRDVAE